MKFQEFIGIDVSKSTIDVVIYTQQLHQQFENHDSDFNNMVSWIGQRINCPWDQVLFAFEHTGLYSVPLSVFLDDNSYKFTIIPGLELNKSLGITRGKDDKIDAGAIAQYAYEKQDRIELYHMPDKLIARIKHLLTHREKLVKTRASFQTSLQEYKNFLDEEEAEELLFSSQDNMIKYLDQQIHTVEARLSELIKQDQELYQQYKLINSIKGVGYQTALMMIVLTNGFKQFNKWRKFASYAGTAPFPRESGKFKGRDRVNNLANKKIKALLSSCANVAIQFNPEIKMYYQRRIEQGKNKMSTINIVRNKLLARIFAVVHRGTPYVETHKFAA